MKLITRFCSIALVLLWSAAAWGAVFGVTEGTTSEFPIDADGSLYIDNNNAGGVIEIIGTDARVITLTVQKTVRGVDQNALAEGRDATQIQLAGDNHTRAFRTIMPLLRTGRWAVNVSYTVHVPKTIDVGIGANAAERIRVANMSGRVRVKNVNGAITFENLTGPASADSVNGNINYESATNPTHDADLSTVNGEIAVIVPSEASFHWIGTTLRGDLMTTFPARGRFSAAALNTFKALIGSRGPTITTSAMMGNIWLLRRGTSASEARSVRVAPKATPKLTPTPQPQIARALQVGSVDGPFNWATALGNISVGQVRGSTRLETGAGEVQLGSVTGECTVVSRGGPLSLGDIFGGLNASTRAGDILVNAARAGGVVSTGGGMIRLLYAGGGVNLRTGGGDILVRHATGPVTADTKSGDISINFDPTLRTTAIDVKSSKGSVTVGLSPRFAADVDATVVSADADSDYAIHSEFSGLTIRREQVGGKTRIRATGKINGGGERVVLYSEEGDIFINFARPVAR